VIVVSYLSAYQGNLDARQQAALGVAIGVTVAIALVSALLSYLSTKPLRDVNEVLNRFVELTVRQRAELEQQPLAAPSQAGMLSDGVPVHEWERVWSKSLEPSVRNRFCGSWVVGKLVTEVRRLQDTLSRLLRESAAAADDAIARNAARKQFVRSLFHDVRVPLSAMRMAIDQMSPEQRESDLVTIVTEQCDTATRLLNNVLTLDKMETGELSLAVSPFRMADCVTRTLRMFAPIAVAKNIPLNASISSLRHGQATVLSSSDLMSNITQSWSLNSDPEVLGDCTRISQIVSNLLSNGMCSDLKSLCYSMRW